MRHSLSHRLLTLLLALAMQLCCCRVHAILAGDGCAVDRVDPAGCGACCCRHADGGGSEDSEQPRDGGQEHRGAPDGCPCDLAFVKAPATHHDVSIPAPEVVEVLPFEMPQLVALGIGESLRPRWNHAPPDRPGGRAAVVRFNRRLI